MGKTPRVEIKQAPADLAADIADEMAARTLAAPTSTEPFEAHITTGAKPNLGPRRPSELPPKAYVPPRNFDDIN